ncbi:MAG: hypothetical protein H7Y88_12780 [Phycisphaerales bacterium]|nr:hypothetical protein [Phycisphaerales bacterium]
MRYGVTKTVAFVPKGLQRQRAKRCEQERVGTIPRVSRLMALAIQIQERIDRGELKDYAEVARVSHLTRARLTQIMNLLALAPSVQEELLFLPPTTSGRDRITERAMRSIAVNLNWSAQKRDFRAAWSRTQSHEVFDANFHNSPPHECR